MTDYSAIVIGVSAGGMNALSAILPELPEDFPLPVIVVQHMAPDSDNFLSILLNERSSIAVKEAEGGERIKGGHVYLAPPDYHLLIELDRTFGLSQDCPVNCARPSIDILFESAADVYGDGLVGVILTGANEDGTQGLKRIKERGWLTIVQNPASAESNCMPRSVLEAIEVDYILELEDIGPFLERMCTCQLTK